MIQSKMRATARSQRRMVLCVTKEEVEERILRSSDQLDDGGKAEPKCMQDW